MIPTAETVERCLPLIERCVVLVYDHSSQYTGIDDTQKECLKLRQCFVDIAHLTSHSPLLKVKLASMEERFN